MDHRISPALKAECQRCDIPEARMRRVLGNELAKWDIEDVGRTLKQVDTFVSIPGNSDPCGPKFNVHVSLPFWIRVFIWGTRLTGIIFLLPISLCSAAYLGFWQWKWRAVVEEIPRPMIDVASAFASMDAYIKAPEALIRESIQQKRALCVNRRGQFRLVEPGGCEKYAVLSYVWGVLMAWQKPVEWGAVELSVRRRGLNLHHLERLFDLCCESFRFSAAKNTKLISDEGRNLDYEWMWLDILAMPEVLEDMTSERRKEIEVLRSGVINNMASIYGGADRLTVADYLLRRTRTGSILDCAVVLCCSWWMTRLWTFAESRLARKVLVRTADYAFDLDDIIEFLTRMTVNDEHKYWDLLRRLSYLRPTPQGTERVVFRTDREREVVREGKEVHILQDVLAGTVLRYTNIRVDHARVLFPLVGLSWESHWSARDGFEHLSTAFPQYKQCIAEYYNYRSSHIEREDSIIGKSWDNDVVTEGRAEAF